MIYLRANHLNFSLERFAFAFLVMFVLPFTLIACGGSETDTEPNAADDKTVPDGDASDDGNEAGLFGGFHETDEIIIEAEDGVVEEPMVKRIDDSDPRLSEIHRASGGKYVHLPKGSGGGDEAGGKVTLEFEVDSDSPGRRPYVLWARVRWTDACSNTFKVVMDGGEPKTIGGDRTYNTWQWVRIAGSPGIFRLRHGKHKLELKNSEDDVSLDKILLTTDADERFQPQGFYD